jgi:hypothetical protein
VHLQHGVERGRVPVRAPAVVPVRPLEGRERPAVVIFPGDDVLLGARAEAPREEVLGVRSPNETHAAEAEKLRGGPRTRETAEEEQGEHTPRWHPRKGFEFTSVTPSTIEQ